MLVKSLDGVMRRERRVPEDGSRIRVIGKQSPAVRLLTLHETGRQFPFLAALIVFCVLTALDSVF